jgi:hypothetical protein
MWGRVDPAVYRGAAGDGAELRIVALDGELGKRRKPGIRLMVELIT